MIFFFRLILYLATANKRKEYWPGAMRGQSEKNGQKKWTKKHHYTRNSVERGCKLKKSEENFLYITKEYKTSNRNDKVETKTKMHGMEDKRRI